MSLPDLSLYTNEIEHALRQTLHRGDADSVPLYGMMQYHLGWLDRDLQPHQGRLGKRLRPVLCLLACQACDGDWHRALPAACAIELLHNFTLIHDDIEDNSALRHERATVWNVWGLAQGVNTGDAMWSLSRMSVLSLGAEGFGPDKVLSVARLLEETSLALCEGQYLDISFETRDDVTRDEYLRMIEGKTAALLSAALRVGALLGGASDQPLAAWGQLGRELGLAFQIIDDILGIWGDPAMTGKSAASDILEAKKTLPILQALAWEAEQPDQPLSALYAGGPLDESQVPLVLKCLEQADSLAYAQRQAALHHEAMRQALATIDGSEPAMSTLRALTAALLERRY